MAVTTQSLESQLQAQFEAQFGHTCERAYRAPGRVNLIGEHTDYNLGFVLPIALDMACSFATAANTQGKLRVYSQNENELAEWSLEELAVTGPRHKWTDYVAGVAQQLLEKGYAIPALDVFISSTVPVGSGLSSSAAIEVSTALGLLQGRAIDTIVLAQLCQRAEIEFVGMPCGIMDQYVSVFGEPHKAIRIDCRDLTHEAVGIPENVAIVAVNSMVKHELGTSAYRNRVRECQEAVESIQALHPEVKSLRDVSSELLESCKDSMKDLPYRRARHIASDDERVLEFVEASKQGDLAKMGKLFVDSHRSMQHDYEITCDEVDYLVDSATLMPGVYGARMTGGGFGGCTVNLVAPEATSAFEREIVKTYEARYSRRPDVFHCNPAAGASQIL